MYYFDDKKEKYVVCNEEQEISSYSIKEFGDYAEKIAILADKYKYPVRNYFEIKDNHAVLYILSKKYGCKKTKVDIDKLKDILKYKWSLKKDRNTFYCQSSVKGERKNILLHRFVLNYNGNMIVDHVNRNGLDNRRSNLRLVTLSMNSRNSRRSDCSNIRYIEQCNYKAFRTNVQTENGRRTKLFNIKNYKTEEDALNDAKAWVRKHKKNSGYLKIVNVKSKKI